MNLLTLLTVLAIVVCVVLLLRLLFWGLLTWWVFKVGFSLQVVLKVLFWFIIFVFTLFLYLSNLQQ